MLYKNKNGFTLVELAIVLVIIGLLVGGVLVGQELIRQAKIIKFITSVDRYRLAISTFRTKYDVWPGFYSKADIVWQNCIPFSGNANIGGGCNGSGISFYDGNSSQERLYMFKHLSLAELISSNHNVSNINGAYPEFDYLPDFKKFTMLPMSTSNLQNIVVARDISVPWFYFNTGVYQSNEPLRVESVRSVDIKTDDGKPKSGNMWQVYSGNDLPECYDVNTLEYADPDQNGQKDCHFVIKY